MIRNIVPAPMQTQSVELTSEDFMIPAAEAGIELHLASAWY